MTDAGRLGEAWGRARPGKGLSASPDPSVPLLGVPREAAAAARLARSGGKSRQEETQEAWEGRRGRMWLSEPLWGSRRGGLGPEEVLPPSALVSGRSAPRPPSPVVPEVKMYRHVSVMLSGADRYPGTGPSPSAEASASRSLMPAEWAAAPAAHRWRPMALRAGRSGPRDSANSADRRTAQLRGCAHRRPAFRPASSFAPPNPHCS